MRQANNHCDSFYYWTFDSCSNISVNAMDKYFAESNPKGDDLVPEECTLIVKRVDG